MDHPRRRAPSRRRSRRLDSVAPRSSTRGARLALALATLPLAACLLHLRPAVTGQGPAVAAAAKEARGAGPDRDRRPVEPLSLGQDGCGTDPVADCHEVDVFYRFAVDRGNGRALDAEDLAWGCAGGSSEACSDLGFVVLDGLGPPGDPARAAELFERACEAGLPLGCNNLGVMAHHGLGVDRDAGRAATLYGRACEAGEDLGCDNLELLRSEGPRPAPAGRQALVRAEARHR